MKKLNWLLFSVPGINFGKLVGIGWIDIGNKISCKNILPRNVFYLKILISILEIEILIRSLCDILENLLQIRRVEISCANI